MSFKSSQKTSTSLMSYLCSLPKSTLPRLYSDGYTALLKQSFPTLPRGNWAVKTLLSTMCSNVEKTLIFRLLMLTSPKANYDISDESDTVGVTYSQFKAWFSQTVGVTSSEENDVENHRQFAKDIALHFNIEKLVKLGVVICPLFDSKADSATAIEIDFAPSSSSSSPQETYYIKLTKPFHLQLRLAMTSIQTSPWTVPSSTLTSPALDQPTTTSTTATTIIASDYLEMYTQKRWDSVLHFLVGSEGHALPPDSVVNFLIKAGLMVQFEVDDNSNGKKNVQRLVISSEGYEFMLHDVHIQIWQFILQYVQGLEIDANADELIHESLLFLLSLSHCVVGVGYSVKVLNKISLQLMKDFSAFGLIYYEKGMDLFYPTRVALTLISGASSSQPVLGGDSGTSVAMSRTPAATKALENALSAPSAKHSPHIAIIVQTNFQVIAYTGSDLHVAMLSLFCDVESMRRLPNMVVSQLTRESVKGAFGIGITANQILRFLKMHAHPNIVNNVLATDGIKGILPDNVEDQIMLWNRERVRLKFDDCYKIQCSSSEQFDAVEAFAKGLNNNACLWSSKERNLVLVKIEYGMKVLRKKQMWEERRRKAMAVQQQQQQGGVR